METSHKALLVAVGVVVATAAGLSLMSHRPELPPTPEDPAVTRPPATTPLPAEGNTPGGPGQAATPPPSPEAASTAAGNTPPTAEAVPPAGEAAGVPPGDVLMKTRKEIFRPVVQASGTQIRVVNQNHSDYLNCVFVVNPKAVGPDYRVGVSYIGPSQSVDIGYFNFVDPTGNPFNPFRMKLDTFSSICEFQGRTETVTGKM